MSSQLKNVPSGSINNSRINSGTAERQPHESQGSLPMGSQPRESTLAPERKHFRGFLNVLCCVDEQQVPEQNDSALNDANFSYKEVSELSEATDLMQAESAGNLGDEF